MPLAAVLAIHERLVSEHGGRPGLRDAGLLESALASPRNTHAYGERALCVLAAAYAAAITRDHPFHDGNKRVSLTVAAVFLELNGLRLEASEADAATATRALAARTLDPADYAAWLERHAVRVPAPRPRAASTTKRRRARR